MQNTIISEVFLTKGALNKQAVIRKYMSRCALASKDLAFIFFSEDDYESTSFSDYECDTFKLMGIGDYRKMLAVIDGQIVNVSEKIRPIVELDLNIMSYYWKHSRGESLPSNINTDKMIDLLNYIKSNNYVVDFSSAAFERASTLRNNYDEECFKGMIESILRFKNEELLADEYFSETLKTKDLISSNGIAKSYDFIYCMLLKAYILKHSGINSPKKRVTSFIDFCFNDLNCPLENELYLITKYLENDKSVFSLFEKVNGSPKRPLAELKNITWDIFHFRLLEFIIGHYFSPESIPLLYLASNDKKLTNPMSINPVIGLAINMRTKKVTPQHLYNITQDYPDLTEKYGTLTAAEKRKNIVEHYDIKVKIAELETEIANS